MRFAILATTALSFCFFLGSGNFASCAEIDADLLVVVESISSGSAVVWLPGESQGREVKERDSLPVGADLQTDSEGVLDLRLADGSSLRLAPDSRITIAEINKNEEGWISWLFGLSEGFVRGLVRSENSKDGAMKLRIRTPLAQMGVRGTEFSFGIESEEVVLETHSGGVLLGAADASPARASDFERVGKGLVSQFRKGEMRARPAIKLADARQKFQGPSARFFSRSQDLGRRPILLKARFREMRSNELKQIQKNFEQVQKRKPLANSPQRPMQQRPQSSAQQREQSPTQQRSQLHMQQRPQSPMTPQSGSSGGAPSGMMPMQQRPQMPAQQRSQMPAQQRQQMPMPGQQSPTQQRSQMPAQQRPQMPMQRQQAPMPPQQSPMPPRK